MKREVRFLGIDDGPFRFDDGEVRVLGVITRGPSYVEGLLSTWVTIDGTDATESVVRMIESTRFRPTVRAVFLNGVTLGGFNIVDLDVLAAKTRLPIVSVTRDRPDLVRSRAALRKHFSDADARIEALERLAPTSVGNGKFRVWACARGLSDSELRAALEAATVRGAIPEPIRLAHMIGSGLTSGESRGPA